MSSIGAIALSGLHAATRRLDKAAGDIAQTPARPEADPVTDMVDLITAGHDFSANLAVMRTDDEIAKALLDIIV